MHQVSPVARNSKKRFLLMAVLAAARQKKNQCQKKKNVRFHSMFMLVGKQFKKKQNYDFY